MVNCVLAEVDVIILLLTDYTGGKLEHGECTDDHMGMQSEI
jgi:hypothetical protein